MQQDYGALIEYLNARDAQAGQRRGHRLPIECYAASDCEFFFTVCARHQGQPFLDEDLASAVVASLLWRRDHHNWLLYCYCLMPDHLHFILSMPAGDVRLVNAGARGEVPETVLDHIGLFKSFTTTQVWWPRGGKGQLWQAGSYDRVMRRDGSPAAAVGYVLNNPVRKGIVDRWEDYPYSRMVDLAW